MSDTLEERVNKSPAKFCGGASCDNDVIVTLVGEGIPAPEPFPTTCTTNNATEQQMEFGASINIPHAGTRSDAATEGSRQVHISLTSAAWNLDKKRRKWKPMPIQRQAWPILLQRPRPNQHAGTNLIAVAPTSSGKTLAYGIPMLCQQLGHVRQLQSKNHRNKNPTTKSIVGLVLVPTRELCAQVQAQFGNSNNSNDAVAIYGGVDRDEQVAALKRKPTIVVATPGRFVDVLRHQKSIPTLFSTATLHYFVLDEADRLATHRDMAEQVDEIMTLIGIAIGNRSGNSTPKQPPTVALFSATAPHKAQKKWMEWVGPNYIHICVKPKVNNANANASGSIVGIAGKEQELMQQTTAKPRTPDTDYTSKIPEHLAQMIFVCNTAVEKTAKLVATLDAIQKLDGRQRSLVLVFFREIKTLVKMSQLLSRQQQSTTGKGKKKKANSVAEFHGKMSQRAREQTLQNFRSGKGSILLATDICARGIHVPNVWYVIHYDFPDEMEQYSTSTGVGELRGMLLPSRSRRHVHPLPYTAL